MSDSGKPVRDQCPYCGRCHGGTPTDVRECRDRIKAASGSFIESLTEDIQRWRRIESAVIYAHSQKADDRCWMDISRVYEAAGLGPHDLRVGDKEAMLENCRHFVKAHCEGGGWPSYAELEAALEVCAGSIRAAQEKADDAPMSADAILDEALAVAEMFVARPAGVYSAAAAKLRGELMKKLEKSRETT